MQTEQSVVSVKERTLTTLEQLLGENSVDAFDNDEVDSFLKTTSSGDMRLNLLNAGGTIVAVSARAGVGA